MGAPVLACVLLPLALATAACSDKPKVEADKSKVSSKTEAIPEDFVMNPFLGQNDEKKVDLTVRGDAAVPVLPGAEGAPPGAEATPPPAASTTTVIEAGAEPRVERKYAFTVGKTETRVATVVVEAQREGTPAQGDPPIKITLAVTPTKKAGDGAVFSLKATKFEMVARTPQEKAMFAEAGPALAAAAGLTTEVSIDAHGGQGEPAFQSPPGPGAQVAEQLAPVMASSLEVLFPSLPKEAIGVGAKWKHETVQQEGGTKVTSISQFELVSVTGDVLVIKGDIAKKSPKQPAQDPRMPPDSLLEIDGTGHYEWTLKLSHAASKAKGENTTKLKVTVPQRGEVVQSVKTAHTIESL